MKNYLTKLIRNTALALMLITSSSVFATGMPKDMLYFGFGMVQTDLNINQENIIAINGLGAGSTFKNNGLSLNLMVGINLDEYLSFELGAIDLGSISLNDGTTTQEFMSATTVYTDAVFKQQISDNIKSFVKLGVSFWSTLNKSNDNTSEGLGLHYGAGLDINVYGASNRVMRLLWEHHEFDQVILNDADSLSLSVLFHF